MPYLPSLHEGASLLQLFKAYPQTSRPLLEFHEVLLRGPSPFSEAERELIAAYVSGLNGCRYCHGVHTATAERFGISPGVVTQLLENPDAAPVPDRMRPVLHYARVLTVQPGSAPRDGADAILAAGWGEVGLYHTVATTALFNFMNRLVEGLGITLEPTYAQAAAERLSKGGYQVLINMLGG